MENTTKSSTGDGRFYPGVSILKPIKGIDDELKENLVSFFEQDYPVYELIFGLQDKSDPSIPIIQDLISKYNHIRAKIIINEHMAGRNPKINNLLNIYPAVTYNYLLISDSNTRVEENFLKIMMNTILKSDVGLVTATVRGVGSRSIPSIMENLHLNTFIAPNVFLADKIAGKALAIGKSMLFHKSVLDQLGGFESFKDFLGEDYLFGKWVSELGLKVRVLPEFVNNINQTWSLKSFLNRHTRWAKMRRHSHLGYYLAEPVSNPTILAMILMLSRMDLLGFLQAFLIIFIKIVHDAYISVLMEKRLSTKEILFDPVKDLIIGMLWIIPFFSYKVKWRGNKYKIYKDTLIQPVYE